MEETYLSQELPDAQIQAFLQEAMLGLTVFPWALLLGEEAPVEFDSSNPTHIFFEALPAEVPEYGWHLAIYRTPGADDEARALWLGRQLSARFDLAVLVPFTHPDKPHDPYYDIVFRQGVSYLADDSETEFGEPDAQPVRILGPYALPEVTFGALGQRIEASQS
ncbi:hypothetical protein [Hymenobacter chitinivorans]|uniref:Uncharacterized protein n=1 Tax=Hymenobacter chitinivorans DSM 11115 TaxID=1121954 RepID=A0A2M9BPX6_9BACT|nr:hypothetical protein [Hymenobacter chitinivorans]PJJ59993.1 hypothetical protein CLV45_1418 [Hymenobacter chitinivorans DSM 11115]